MKSLEGVALVTGAGRRVGAEIARTLHGTGINVAIHCLNSRSEADALAAGLNRARPDSARVFVADLLDTDALPVLAEQAHAAWGRLDVLVNNASSFFRTPAGEITETTYEDLMGSNLKAPVFLTQACIPYLAASEGCVVNISDVYASRPLANYPVYCAAKAGLEALTRVLAHDLAPRIRVNAVAPSAILWPIDGKDDEKGRNRFLEKLPMHRLGGETAIANAVRFLVSEESGFITGSVLTVDGGESLVTLKG